jgi:murein DD-endopeptidase MepM/ murein hydrolase activator NlpD
MVAHVARGLRRVLPGLLLVLVTATAGCGSDPPRPAAAAQPGPAPSSATPLDAPPSSAEPSSAAPSSAAASPTPSPHRYTFPIGAAADYGRTHGEYPATDIFANCGSPVRAVTDGSVMELSRVDRFDPNNSQGAARGGLFVAIHGDDGVRYYSAHLSALAPGIDVGVRVAAGTLIGKVGHTGNANGICHVHFAISPPCGVGDWWNRRGLVWPWRYLDAWRARQNLSPAAEVAAWQAAHGCPLTLPPGVT